MDDVELLRSYAADRSDEEAFSELVRRRLDLVYSAALRQVGGDAHRAKDVTQIVFTSLAREAAALSSHPALVGWLYTATRFAATKMMRSERSRESREKEAITMYENQTPAADWEQLRPVLDETMHELDDDERQAILLRFFENLPLESVGAQLGLTENAAQKKVQRSLDRLHGLLARRGIKSTAAAVTLVLSQQAIVAAPVGLAKSVAASSVSAVLGVAGTTTLIMSTTTKLSAAAALVAAGIVSYLYLSQDQARNTEALRLARNANATLEKRIWDADQNGRKLEADLKTAQDEAEKSKVKLFPDPPIREYPGTRDVRNIDLSNLTTAKLTSMAQIRDSYKPIYDELHLSKVKEDLLTYHLSNWGGSNFDGSNAAIRDGVDILNDPLMVELFQAAARDDSVQSVRELLGAEDYAKLVRWTASSPYRASMNQVWALNGQLQRDRYDALDPGQSDQVLQSLLASAPPNGGAPGVPVKNQNLKFNDAMISRLSTFLSPSQVQSVRNLAASQAKTEANQAAQVQKARAIVSQLK